MRYATVCSGIGCPEVAWSHLGWEHAFVSEIDPFACAVLAHRFPSVPNLGDLTKIGAEHGPVDLLCGGTPCQSFSVAGRRAGLDDPRGVLAFEFLRLAGRLRARWVVWENVPGVLSSNGGRDFGAFLRALGDLGYGFAYRVLDAQWFGLAQRRARVFVVAHLGDWRGPCAVLLEPEGLRGDSAPCRSEGEGVAPTLANRARGGGGLGTDAECDGALIPAAQILMQNTGQGGNRQVLGVDEPHPTLNLRQPNALLEIAHTLKSEGADASEDGTGRGVPLVVQDDQNLVVAHPVTASGTDGMGRGVPMAVCPTVTSKWAKGSGGPAGSECGNLTAERSAVRRFTPKECERLQGLPDSWTLVPYRGKPAKDGPRYRAIGNGMAVPVLRWIGERIAMWESL